MSIKYNEHTALTQGELEELEENLILELDDNSTQDSGSEIEDSVEFENFEDSGNEYLPSEDDSSDKYSYRAKNNCYIKNQMKKNM